RVHGVQEAVGEFFGGDETHVPVRMRFANADVDAFEQVCFASADGTVKHEWIRSLARRFDDAQRGGMGDTIASADNEIAQAMPAPRRVAAGFAVLLLGLLVPRHNRRLHGLRFSARLLKERGIDAKADGYGMAERLRRRGCDRCPEFALKIILLEEVRHPDR